MDFERETLHVMDDQRRVALVETKTLDAGVELDAPTSRDRYQLDNHLSSSLLELDEVGQVNSYEEYFPYGGTAYRAARSSVEVSVKRYRYNGKERDEETGLHYYGVRFYAAWLGRWTSADPDGLVDGINLFSYVRSQPINYLDEGGRAGVDPQVQQAVGKARENLWRSHVESVSDDIVEQRTYKDPRNLTKRGTPKTTKLGSPKKSRVVDLVGTNVLGSGRNIEYEVSSHKQFETKSKKQQLARSKEAIGKGHPVGPSKGGKMVRVHDVHQAKGLPIVGEGGNVVGSKGIQPERFHPNKPSTATSGVADAIGKTAGGDIGVDVKKTSKWVEKFKRFGAGAAKVLTEKGGKLIPFAGIGVGVGLAAYEASKGNYATAFVEAAGASEIPIVAQVADIGSLVADVTWVAIDTFYFD